MGGCHSNKTICFLVSGILTVLLDLSGGAKNGIYYRDITADERKLIATFNAIIIMRRWGRWCGWNCSDNHLAFRTEMSMWVTVSIISSYKINAELITQFGAYNEGDFGGLLIICDGNQRGGKE